MREMIERSWTSTLEEDRVIMNQYFDADIARWKIMRDMLRGEVAGIDPSDHLKLLRLAGPERMTQFAQLILDRAAEPSHGLTPDDLKMVEKAVFHVASISKKGMNYMKVGRFALSAGFLYYVYTTLNWLP